ncbi:amino acid ABC transporter substrate-binding protein [Azospirillum thiophilum]|uniref:Amino acid ABC transporter substrate-binding protein n=1 Tax=Azospirillum thiophilum TaxID=528244 RepID=A0AAC8ZTZ3_9PROT|nr:transporter substrate-binding domain-containing protein [Azospirillum thiophilum]ALG71167.1 amino acid ABC transporter substrate-binding protein [Azospirillum thiophilum]KJR65178.1 amino acid ABC transporter substrate-binding protein [Azospirillum thiophilum]
MGARRTGAAGDAGQWARRAFAAPFVLAGLFLATTPAPLRAADAGPGPVRAPYTGLDLVTGDDYAPYTGEDLPGGGLVTDMVRRAFALQGRQYDVRFMPWKRGYDGVVAGRFLATFPYVRTPERESEVLFSDPVIEVRQFVYLSNRTAMTFHGPTGDREETAGSSGAEEFRGRTVCQPVGYALPPELEALVERKGLTRQTPSDLGACVRMVATGRADAFIIDEYSAAAAIARSGLADDIRMSERPYAVVTFHLVVGRATPGADSTVAAFNDGLKALKSQGAYRDLLTSHTLPPPP